MVRYRNICNHAPGHLNWMSMCGRPPSTWSNWDPNPLSVSVSINCHTPRMSKMLSHCAKRHWSLWHIRKTNSSSLYHRAAACVLLSPPGVKLQSWAMGVDRRWAKWKALTRTDQRLWQVTGVSRCLLDRVVLVGGLFFFFYPDEQHCN